MGGTVRLADPMKGRTYPEQPITYKGPFEFVNPNKGMIGIDVNEAGQSALDPYKPNALPAINATPIERDYTGIRDAISRRLQNVPEYVYNTDRSKSFPSSRNAMMENAIARRTASGSRLPTPGFNGGKNGI